jgi:hypothetical protein
MIATALEEEDRSKETRIEIPLQDRKVVHACRFDQWSKQFNENTFQFRTIECDHEVCEFILRDRVMVSEDGSGVPKRKKRDVLERLGEDFLVASSDSDSDSDCSDSSDDEEDEDDDDDEKKKTSKVTTTTTTTKTRRQTKKKNNNKELSEEFMKSIEDAIIKLGGCVHPKLTWSAPTDAVWLTQFSTKCMNANEVVLLLQSSDRVAHDLDGGAYAHCEDCDVGDNDCLEDVAEEKHSLTLRKHSSTLELSREFRAFVVDGEIRGISQRDVSSFYPFLITERKKIGNTIERFWKETIKPTIWHRNCAVGYCVDLVLSNDNAKVRFIIDFNPFGGATLPLLFSYEELTSRNNNKNNTTTSNDDEKDNNSPSSFCVEVRVVETQGKVLPSKGFGVPYDLVDTSESSAIAEFIRRQQREQQHERL